MADVKISQLPQASLPLTGAEIFPLVQNGVTVQAPINGVNVVSTIAALRAIPPGDSLVVTVEGYYSNADGGGGQFCGVTGGSYTDNGGTIITPNGGTDTSAWLRLYSGMIDVSWFGADNTGVDDATTAIQSAINVGNIYIPPGSYKVTNRLTTPIQRTIVGSGGFFAAPRLNFSGTGYTQCINMGENSAISGIRLVDETNAKIGIQINGAYNRIENCLIETCDIGIYWFGNNNGNSEILGNFVRNCVTANVKCFRAHNLFFANNRLEYADYNLMFEVSCYDSMIVCNELSHSYIAGLSVDALSVAIKVIGNAFGAHDQDGILMGKYHMSVVGNHFTDITRYAIYSAINNRSSVITDNTFNNCGGTSIIQLQSGNDNYQISNNIFGRSDRPALADTCITVRFAENVQITGNHFTGAYITSPLVIFAPTGPIYYQTYEQNVLVTNVSVADGLNSVLTSRSVTGSGFFTTAINVSFGRALTCTITNPTGAPIAMPALDFYSEFYVGKTTIPAQTIAAGASITITGRADNPSNPRVTLNSNGVAVPVGLTYTCGVSDRFRVRENITDLATVSCTINGNPATLSSYSSVDYSFLVSPSPATGDTMIFSYTQQLNFS